MMDGTEWDDLPKIEDVTATDAKAEVARLAALDPAAYETERKDAAARLGWRAAILDAEVQKARPAKPKGDEGDDAPEAIEMVEPWPDPVDGESLACELRDRIAGHVIFGSRHDADLVSLWVLGAYLNDVWRLWPKLLITSPTRQCGKSTLMEVLEAVLPRALLASNASTAAIFRAIETMHPSLLLDEADTWLRQNEELAGIINSGHTRRTASVLRTVEVNGDHVVRRFSTWGPMVVAGIGDQRDTLTSRSIVIGLRRKLADETTLRMPADLFDQMLRLRRQAARWAEDNALTIGASELDPPPCGDDRRRDNFGPLFRLAAVLGGDWPNKVAAGYLAKSEAAEDGAEDAGVMLLRDMMEIFDKRRASHIGTSDLVGELIMLEGQPWQEWKHGRPITSHGVARLMRPFDVRPRNVRELSSVLKGYQRADVYGAFIRYAKTPTSEPLHRYTPENITKSDDPIRYTTDPCSGFEIQKDKQEQRCSGVADKSGGLSEQGREPLDLDDPHNPDAWI
ncbi:MAG: DUF3631 domain-containing protein [Rubellimicrobium sp.]|nr:DUF3631 domain-containing protein [Rubellimicrobium sp.]